MKPALRRILRDECTLQLGVHPLRSVMLSDLTKPVLQWVEGLDGTRDLRAVLHDAARAGLDEPQARSLLEQLAARGALHDASVGPGPLRDLPLAERDRLKPDLDALDLGSTAPDGMMALFSRRREARVRVYGAGRVGAQIVALLAAAGVGHLRVIDPDTAQPSDITPGGLTWAEMGMPREAGAVAVARRATSGGPVAALEADGQHEARVVGKATRGKRETATPSTASDVTDARTGATGGLLAGPAADRALGVPAAGRATAGPATAARAAATPRSESTSQPPTSPPQPASQSPTCLPQPTSQSPTCPPQPTSPPRSPSPPQPRPRHPTPSKSSTPQKAAAPDKTATPEKTSRQQTAPASWKTSPQKVPTPQETATPGKTTALRNSPSWDSTGKPATPSPTPTRAAPGPGARTASGGGAYEPIVNALAGGPYLGDKSDRPDLVILSPVNPLDRVLVNELLALRIPHLLVSAFEGHGTVGPLVLPGDTACLHCLDLTRRDHDPTWPIVTARLGGYPPGEIACDVALATVVAAEAVGHALAFLDGREPVVTNGTLDVTPDWRWSGRAWEAHPQCRCMRNNPYSLRMVVAPDRD
ncbi:hypothetical protein GCM10022224_053450 [Nonomuraea antimicrobica]|uniref:THIF-type NAD/FAD binding fold domain-containing protein n=1 Tax=Nonomuraea antimicrobica TaxID=561173 RepID=A0ABP7C905_9ACTN